MDVRRIAHFVDGRGKPQFRLTVAGTSNSGRSRAEETELTCQRLLLATGLGQPNVPDIDGIEHAVGYEDAPIDPDVYAGKRVLILGNGNSGFEMATSIYSRAAYVHIAGYVNTALLSANYALNRPCF